MVDQNLEGGASEGAEDLELELEPGSDKGLDHGQGGDPLDEIKDPVARAEAKKHRAIARRIEEKKPDEKPKAESPQEFLTKADFQKANERKAILAVTADVEVKANWDAIIPFYTPRRGKETPEDIAEDIKDAIILFKARNPDVIKDDSARVLSSSPVIKAGGGASGKDAPKIPDPPNFHLPAQPKDWYPKK